MSWKTAYRSFYYQDAPEPEDIVLVPAETALLVIDIQNTYMAPKPDPADDARWQPFFQRMRGTVIPNTARLIETSRKVGVEPVFARVACHKLDGRDRSLSQKKPGFNYLLLPKDRADSQVVPELAPKGDEIVITKTTDSALTGTNLRLILHNISACLRPCAASPTRASTSSWSRTAAPPRPWTSTTKSSRSST
jgi:biuret amidohydrolase